MKMSTGTTEFAIWTSCVYMRGLVRSYPGSHVVLSFAQALVSSRNRSVMGVRKARRESEAMQVEVF
jgi:hypothetical protein